MAAPRKSAKRSAAKKRPAAKRQPTTTKKKSKPKRATRTTALKRKARKGLKAARGGLDSVIQAGGKTWKTLKATTTQVVKGVKKTLASESRPAEKRRRP